MNKIIIRDDKIDASLDESVKLSKETYISLIQKITIDIKQNTDLIIEYTNTDKIKLDINVSLKKGLTCNIYEIKKNGKYKLSYKYDLDKDSKLNIVKVHDVNKIKELVTVNLNGQNSKINYTLKTISKDEEKYDLMIYHNEKNTESLVTNNGVNIKDGTLKFEVSGFVPNKIINCVLNQNNRIINLTDHKCIIRPNLFIDENDVIANHSAHIGKCNDEEMFYLMSRGIEKKEAENLIIKGFLLKGLTKKEDMENIIDKYWR